MYSVFKASFKKVLEQVLPIMCSPLRPFVGRTTSASLRTLRAWYIVGAQKVLVNWLAR